MLVRQPRALVTLQMPPAVVSRLSALLLAATFTACGSPQVQETHAAPRVVIDGQFDDWLAVSDRLTDPLDAPAGAAVDLREVQLQDDGHWLHVAIDWSRNVNAQSMSGSVRLVFDADGDRSTGGVAAGLAGADLVIALSRGASSAPDGHGAGTDVQPITADGPLTPVSPYLVDLLIGPTVATPRIELRVRRGAAVPGIVPPWTGTGTRLKVVYEDASGVVDETATLDYAFTAAYQDTAPPRPMAGREDILPPDGTTRVVVWNVAERGYLDESDAFLRVLRALDPDVVLLDEVFEGSTGSHIEALLNESALGHGAPWHVALGAGGGRQRTVVASRFAIRPEPELARIDYEAGALERLEERQPGFGRAAAVEHRAGVAASGVWVDVTGRDVLFVPFDLQSAGYAGSWQDELRVLQAEHVSSRVAGLLDGRDGTALILGGDANAVGSDRPLELLRQAAPPPEGPLSVVEARHPVTGAVYTWRDPDSWFPPGRLDYLVFGGSGVSLSRAFPFDPEQFSDEALEALGLERLDARRVSDHLPLVGDFTIQSIQ